MYNEFQIEPRAKYLALLGDIGIAGDDNLFGFLTRQLGQFEVVFYVLGNHEPYFSRYEDAVARIEAFEDQSHPEEHSNNRTTIVSLASADSSS